ncbi:MAG: hypothetical protein C4523_02400 [Myxococcales bacterium]|nr:MAG: hypothetical protein C4523_02400 [Myxococcales bacterium]
MSMGNRQTKPGVDWELIRQRIAAGESLREISKTAGCSHVAISRRARREGWAVIPAAAHWDKRIRKTGTARKLAAAEQGKPGAGYLKRYGLRTPENISIILEQCKLGASERVIAAKIGMSLGGYQAWVESDAELRTQIEDAQADFACRHLDSVSKAGYRGDWKASEAILKRHKLTREDWSDGQGKVAAQLAVQINIGRASPDEQPQVIEISGKTAD